MKKTTIRRGTVVYIDTAFGVDKYTLTSAGNDGSLIWACPDGTKFGNRFSARIGVGGIPVLPAYLQFGGFSARVQKEGITDYVPFEEVYEVNNTKPKGNTRKDL